MSRRSFDRAPDLPQRLTESLAGVPSFTHRRLRRFEPELSYGRHLDLASEHARAAAVAVLIYPHRQDWQIPFVVRPGAMRNHAGQVAFPGGHVDPGESTAEAALRELEEELGIPRSEPFLVGALQPINLFVTNFVVHPWVMLLPERPSFSPCAEEVAEVLETPVSHLLDPQSVELLRQTRNGVVVTAPCIRWQGHAIWGATAILLGQLIDLMTHGNSGDLAG